MSAHRHSTSAIKNVAGWRLKWALSWSEAQNIYFFFWLHDVDFHRLCGNYCQKRLITQCQRRLCQDAQKYSDSHHFVVNNLFQIKISHFKYGVRCHLENAPSGYGMHIAHFSQRVQSLHKLLYSQGKMCRHLKCFVFSVTFQTGTLVFSWNIFFCRMTQPPWIGKVLVSNHIYTF